MQRPIDVKINYETGKAELTFKCTSCQCEILVEANPGDVERYYKEGVHVQYAFPYLDRDTRELFISGTCGECWDRMMALMGEGEDR